MMHLPLALTLFVFVGAAHAQSLPRFEVSNSSIKIAETASTDRFELHATVAQLPAEASRWQITTVALRPNGKALLGGDAIFADGFETAICIP